VGSGSESYSQLSARLSVACSGCSGRPSCVSPTSLGRWAGSQYVAEIRVTFPGRLFGCCSYLCLPPCSLVGKLWFSLCQNIFCFCPDNLCVSWFKGMPESNDQSFFRQLVLMVSPSLCFVHFLHVWFCCFPPSGFPSAYAFVSCVRKLLISIAKKRSCNPVLMLTPNNPLGCSYLGLLFVQCICLKIWNTIVFWVGGLSRGTFLVWLLQKKIFSHTVCSLWKISLKRPWFVYFYPRSLGLPCCRFVPNAHP